MKKLIVLSVMLCMTFISTKILADCNPPSGNSISCTMAPPYGYAHGLYYIDINTDVYYNWYLTIGDPYNWAWVETDAGYNTGGGGGGGVLNTSSSGRLEIWLNSNNGGSGSVYASW